MKAVWSFWTKPFRTHYKSNWYSSKHHLFSWILSFETARKHYPDTVLYTDDQGGEILIDGLGLEFKEVHTSLNELDPYDTDWWVLGKLYAYGAQTTPFAHIDNDIFLWKRFPERMEKADVITQSGGPFPFGSAQCPYQPHILNQNFEKDGGIMPEAMKWYIAAKGNNACCCGITGGTRTDFIRKYASEAMEFITRDGNRRAWKNLDGKLWSGSLAKNIMVEEYFLQASMHYHNRQHPKDKPIVMDYLFPPPLDPYSDKELAKEAGYTHLMGGTKKNPRVALQIEKRVEKDYPWKYDRVTEMFNDHALKKVLSYW